MKGDLSVHTVTETQNRLRTLCAKRQALFDGAKYKYSRQILSYYTQIKSKQNVKPLIKMIAKFEYPQADKFLTTSKIAFPIYPVAKIKMCAKEKEVESNLMSTVRAIDDYVEDYEDEEFSDVRALEDAIFAEEMCREEECIDAAPKMMAHMPHNGSVC